MEAFCTILGVAFLWDSMGFDNNRSMGLYNDSSIVGPPRAIVGV